jgi:hypothetical protein
MEFGMEDKNGCPEPEARWANQFNTGFRPHVIELVFYQNSGSSKARVLTRIITSPDDAKELMINLSKTIEKYEATFGQLCTDDANSLTSDKQ